MKVGDVIELYRIESHGGYPESVFTVGTIRPSKNKTRNLVDLLDNNEQYTPMAHKPFAHYVKEVTIVGRMVIKSLK